MSVPDPPHSSVALSRWNPSIRCPSTQHPFMMDVTPSHNTLHLFLIDVTPSRWHLSPIDVTPAGNVQIRALCPNKGIKTSNRSATASHYRCWSVWRAIPYFLPTTDPITHTQLLAGNTSYSGWLSALSHDQLSKELQSRLAVCVHAYVALTF